MPKATEPPEPPDDPSRLARSRRVGGKYRELRYVVGLEHELFTHPHSIITLDDAVQQHHVELRLAVSQGQSACQAALDKLDPITLDLHLAR